MKRFSLAVLVVFGLLTVTGLNCVSAAGPSDPVEASIPTDVKLHQVNGKVISLDTEIQQMVVKSKKNESSFVLTSDTVIKRGRSAVKPSSLKTGSTVRVRYHEQNGQLIADRVTITSPAGSTRKGAKQ